MGISISDAEYNNIRSRMIGYVNKYKPAEQGEITEYDFSMAGLYTYIIACMNTAYDLNMSKAEEDQLIKNICIQLGLTICEFKHKHMYSQKTAEDRFEECVKKLNGQDSISKDDLKELRDIVYDMMDGEDS